MLREESKDDCEGGVYGFSAERLVCESGVLVSPQRHHSIYGNIGPEFRFTVSVSLSFRRAHGDTDGRRTHGTGKMHRQDDYNCLIIFRVLSL